MTMNLEGRIRLLADRAGALPSLPCPVCRQWGSGDLVYLLDPSEPRPPSECPRCGRPIECKRLLIDRELWEAL